MEHNYSNHKMLMYIAVVMNYYNQWATTALFHIKYQNDIRWVSQNTTLYYGVRCQKVDNMFRPF